MSESQETGTPTPANTQGEPVPKPVPAPKEHSLAKQCRVKYQCLQRYIKEYNSYLKEAVMNENTITKLTQEGKCEHDINKQREVLKETEAMVPIIKEKLSEGVDDLTEFLEENRAELKEVGPETLEAANEQLASTKAFLEGIQNTN